MNGTTSCSEQIERCRADRHHVVFYKTDKDTNEQKSLENIRALRKSLAETTLDLTHRSWPFIKQ